MKDLKSMKVKAGNNIKFIRILKCLVILVSTLLLISCSPMGGHVNEDVSDNHYYNLFHTKVVFGSMGNCWNIGCEDIYEADAKSFEPLNGIYAIDKDSVFYTAKRLRLEKPNNFKILEEKYAIGKRGVYWKGKILTKKHPKSFTILKVENDDESYYMGIGFKHVYENGRIISNEPKVFKHIGNAYFADSKNVYAWHGKIIKGADPLSFKFLKSKSGLLSYYAKDKHNVYAMVSNQAKIEGANYESFEVICTGEDYPELAKDKNYVYGYDRIIEGLNPNDYNYPEICEKYKGRAHIDW